MAILVEKYASSKTTITDSNRYANLNHVQAWPHQDSSQGRATKLAFLKVVFSELGMCPWHGAESDRWHRMCHPIKALTGAWRAGSAPNWPTSSERLHTKLATGALLWYIQALSSLSFPLSFPKMSWEMSAVQGGRKKKITKTKVISLALI